MRYDESTAAKTFCPFEGQTCAICVLCYLCIDHQRVRYCGYGLVIKQLLSFIHLSINDSFVVVCGASLSLAAEVMCISVFPGFWMNFPMILVQELLMTSTVAYIDTLSV